MTDRRPGQIYRYYDAAGKLLYLGVSVNFIARMSQHKQATWFRRAVRVAIEHFPNREAALVEEPRAIRREQPEFNIAWRNVFHAGYQGAAIVERPPEPPALGETRSEKMRKKLDEDFRKMTPEQIHEAEEREHVRMAARYGWKS